MNYKLLSVAVMLAAAMLVMPTTMAMADHDQGNQKSQDKKADKCNNVKVRVNVAGVEAGDDITATATLAGKTITKTIEDIEAEDISEDGVFTVSFNFKKLSPCPAVGDTVSGEVNGVNFSDEIDSLKKPNKISVSLP